ncbi:uncharacterized protein LOC144180052 [Haemaphysalis longicornis]
MPQGGNTAPAPTPGWHPPREPRMFTGNADEDVEEWLTHNRRVSRYNRWGTAAQLSNVVFSLDETALTWFENNESKLTTWGRFVEEISARFGDSVGKKKQAEQTLLHRAQVPGETCTTYIEQVLKLCRLVDPQMSEDDKVGHLLKGIAEDVYNFLIGREKLESASDVVQHCRTFEALKKRRITPKFGRLANVTTVASVNVTPPPDFAETIRRIVREELLRHQKPRRYTDGLNVHESYVLQDVQANSLSPSSAQFRDPAIRLAMKARSASTIGIHHATVTTSSSSLGALDVQLKTSVLSARLMIAVLMASTRDPSLPVSVTFPSATTVGLRATFLATAAVAAKRHGTSKLPCGTARTLEMPATALACQQLCSRRHHRAAIHRLLTAA